MLTKFIFIFQSFTNSLRAPVYFIGFKDVKHEFLSCGLEPVFHKEMKSIQNIITLQVSSYQINLANTAREASEEDPWEVAGGSGELAGGGRWLSPGTFTLHPDRWWVCCTSVQVLEPRRSHTGAFQLRNPEGEEHGDVRGMCEPSGAD